MQSARLAVEHDPAGAGAGVVSMRERAESLGGSCQAGPGGRGWLVRAVFPLAAVPPEAVRPENAQRDEERRAERRETAS